MADRRLSKHFNQHVMFNAFTVTLCFTLLIDYQTPSIPNQNANSMRTEVFVSIIK